MPILRALPAKVKGLTLYDGPSMLDGSAIVAVLILESENQKTGNLQQLVIFPRDVLPTDANRTGKDKGVCGDCPLMGTPTQDKKGEWHAVGRACYVNIGRSVNGTWHAWHRGMYPVADAAMIRAATTGRRVRLGAWGDPAAVPAAIIRKVIRYADGWTGYTHQWRKARFRHLKSFVMASCESEMDRMEAKAMGWRTFRIRKHDQELMAGEIICPASAEGQYRRQCENCLACDGADREGKVDVAIVGHGGLGILPNLNRVLTKHNELVEV